MEIPTIIASPPQPISARAARTREALLCAGLRLFADRPLDAVPIDDIVSSAGVAKGSFFNHFADKNQFAAVIADGIRADLEKRVAVANKGVSDPLERLTRGMAVAVGFAIDQREQAIVMLRGLALATTSDNPLNIGLHADLQACADAGCLDHHGRKAGLLFWLGACHMQMAAALERRLTHDEAADVLQSMLALALRGLGVDHSTAESLAQQRSDELRNATRL